MKTPHLNKSKLDASIIAALAAIGYTVKISNGWTLAIGRAGAVSHAV